MKAFNVTDQTFVQEQTTALVDFGAEWCPPCKAIAPVIDSIAKEFEGKAIIGKIDVDKILKPPSSSEFETFQRFYSSKTANSKRGLSALFQNRS